MGDLADILKKAIHQILAMGGPFNRGQSCFGVEGYGSPFAGFPHGCTQSFTFAAFHAEGQIGSAR